MANTFGNREALDLFEAVTDAVLTINRDWQITYINRNGAAIADLTPDQIIGRVLWEAFPQMIGGPLETHYRQAMESREPLHFTAKGSVRDLWYSISVYPIEDGILIYTVNDDETQKSAIQEQKLLEENLRHKSLLDAIFEADPAALAVLAGPELRFVFANPAYRYLVPDPFRDPLGCTYEEVWQAKNPYDSRRQLRRVLATGQPFQAPSIEISYPDRTRRTFNLQARRIDWGGEEAVLLILWDITELKEAENQLRSTALFPEQNPHPVLRLSPDGRILYTNPASQRLLPEYRPGDRIPEFWRVIARDAYQSRERRIVDFEHRDRMFAFHVVPIPGAGYINLYASDITERKQLLEALQESEKEYRELVQYAPVGIYEVDFRRKCFTSVNEAMCQLSGYSREELFAMGPFALLDEDSRALFQKRIEKWLAGEEPNENVEYRVRMKDGRMVDARLDVSFTTDEQGKPIGAKVVATDNTAQKQTERALRDALKAAEESEKAVEASEIRYRLLAEQSPDAILVNVDNRFVYANRAAAQLVRAKSPKDLIGMSPFDVLEPEYREEIRKRIERILTKPGSNPLKEVRWRRFDGTAVDVEASSVAIRWEGKPAIQVVVRDITERKRAEEYLRFQTKILDTVHEAIIATDACQRVMSWNRGAERLYGWTSAEALGQVLGTFLRSEVTPDVRAQGLRQLEEKDSFAVGEVVQYTKDNRRIIIECSAIPTRDAKGAFSGFVTANRDITERKQLLEALQESEKEYRELVQYAPVGICEVDFRTRRFTNVNDAMCQLGGYSRDELLSLDMFTVLDEESQNVFQKRIQQWAAGENLSENVEYRVKTKDGRSIDALLNVTIKRDEAGNPVGAMLVGLDITERKRAEQALRENEERLQTANARFSSVLDSIQEDFYVLDRDWRFTYASRQFTSRIGKEPKDFVGNVIWEMFPQHLGTTLEENFRATMEKGEIRRFEIPGRYTHAWYSMASFPSPEGITVLGTDITERKRAEEALREALQAVSQSETRYRELADSITDPFTAWDKDLRCIFRNAAAREITFQPDEEVLGKRFEEIYPDLVGTDIHRSYQRVLETRQPEHNEITWTRAADGRVFYRLHSLYPTRDGITAFSHDLTEQRRADQAIRASEERFRVALTNTPITVFTLDKDLHYTWVHHSLMDFDVDQLLGKRDEDLDAYENIGELTALKQQVLDTGQGVQQEFIARHRDRPQHFLLNLQPLFGDDGQVAGLTGAAMDITPLRELEMHQVEYQTRMEVQQRLLEQREQERLRIARDLHDGPVQEILGAMYALQGMIYDKEASNLADGLKGIADVLQRQVAELRAYASELRPPALSKFGLVKAIRSHLDTFQEKHPEIQVQFEGAQDGELIPEDKRLGLFRIYQETMANIAKHAHAPLVTIRLETTRDQVALDIRDNGVGFDIPKDWLELARGGHLGLVGMRERAEAMGGKLQIDSSPGQGTCIRLRVPLPGSS